LKWGGNDEGREDAKHALVKRVSEDHCPRCHSDDLYFLILIEENKLKAIFAFQTFWNDGFEGVSQLSAMAFSASVEPLGADSLPVPVAGVTSRLKCAANMPDMGVSQKETVQRSSKSQSAGLSDAPERSGRGDPEVLCSHNEPQTPVLR
jgi:hypothetical protein